MEKNQNDGNDKCVCSTRGENNKRTAQEIIRDVAGRCLNDALTIVKIVDIIHTWF